MSTVLFLLAVSCYLGYGARVSASALRKEGPWSDDETPIVGFLFVLGTLAWPLLVVLVAVGTLVQRAVKR